jgi:predicted O-methyltransferase YrrM
MNISRALEIPGWMEEKELIWLANEASRHDKIVEIGCWMGRSTRALADNTSGMVLAVDTWKGSEEHQDQLKDKDPDWLYGQFLVNMTGTTNVFPVRLSSTEAAATCKETLRDFDMVFIDASHDYESISADIVAWKPLIKPGGIICGHDRGYPPIHQAVTELLGQAGGDTDIWVKQL